VASVARSSWPPSLYRIRPFIARRANPRRTEKTAVVCNDTMCIALATRATDVRFCVVRSTFLRCTVSGIRGARFLLPRRPFPKCAYVRPALNSHRALAPHALLHPVVLRLDDLQFAVSCSSPYLLRFLAGRRALRFPCVCFVSCSASPVCPPSFSAPSTTSWLQFAFRSTLLALCLPSPFSRAV